jgi:rhamnosyl/mannosyltransferase
MKPITVIVPIPPSYRGGTEEYAYRLAGRIARVRPLRILTTTIRWDPAGAVIDFAPASIERLRAREIWDRPVVTSVLARRRFREAVEDSEIVHLHMPFPLVERWVGGWAERAGVPTICTYHMDAARGASDDSGRIAGWEARLYRRWSAIPAVRRAAVVVSNSMGYAKTSPVLSKFLHKVRVIHKGADPSRLRISTGDLAYDARAWDRPDWNPSSPGAKRIVFVGRLVPYKGLSVLIQAVRELNRMGVLAELFVAGQGALRTRLESEVASLGISERVHFLGFVLDRYVGELYRIADVVACPSLGRQESSPTALEEAAMCGTPVVGSDLPGTDETVPNDGVRGILTPPGDVPALVGALTRILGQRRPSGASAIRTWDDVARDYLALFDEVARRTAR